MGNFKTLFEIIQHYEEQHNKVIMLAGRKTDAWRTFSTIEFMRTVRALSKGFIQKAIKKGDRIALMSGNRPEWNMVDFAANQIGAVLVPLYPTLSVNDLTYVLTDAEVKMLFVSNSDLMEKVQGVIAQAKLEVEVYALDEIDGHQHYKELIMIGERAESIDLTNYQDAVSEDDLATLIYTSGTTGVPKGVKLSHKNILSNVSACENLIPDNFTHVLSFLPLSHIFERMAVYIYLSKGLQIWYSESLDNIVADINEVKPQMFTTVPRVLEKVYDRIVAKGKELIGVKKSLFFWALELGHQYKEPGKNSVWYELKLFVARKLIFSKWKEALGGHVELIISGGAALQERLARIFWAADIKVLEGYGLTETSPVIAANSWKKGGLKFGTVGKVLDNLEVVIAEDGEILVKGPSITQGYYKNDEATQQTIDQRGYLHTGDIGQLTPEGFLSITDRKKEIFKTAGGKYVSPQVLENKLVESIFIAQVMVVGENQRFPCALIVPNFEELEKWLKSKGITFTSKENVLQLAVVQEHYRQIVNQSMESFGAWERVKKISLLASEWTIDQGELTPKLSLKRKVIFEKYKDQIQAIYTEKED